MENQKASSTKTVLIVLGALAATFVVFALGMMVGFQKANFSYRWGENYHKNFGGPRGGFMRDAPSMMWGKGMMNGFGTVGQILKVDGSTLVIKDKDNTEKTITISTTTVIRSGDQTKTVADLKSDEHVMVIGDPGSDGQISAKLIRILP